MFVFVHLLCLAFILDSNTQMQDFRLFYDNGGSEVLLYDSTGIEYGQGVFTIPINPPVTTNAIIIRRDGTLTLCEVEIYGGMFILFSILICI